MIIQFSADTKHPSSGLTRGAGVIPVLCQLESGSKSPIPLQDQLWDLPLPPTFPARDILFIEQPLLFHPAQPPQGKALNGSIPPTPTSPSLRSSEEPRNENNSRCRCFTHRTPLVLVLLTLKQTLHTPTAASASQGEKKPPGEHRTRAGKLNRRQPSSSGHFSGSPEELGFNFFGFQNSALPTNPAPQSLS